MHFSQ